VLANYRKSFLYTTDESWAEEGRGFYAGDIPGGAGKMAMGICWHPLTAQGAGVEASNHTGRVLTCECVRRHGSQPQKLCGTF